MSHSQPFSNCYDNIHEADDSPTVFDAGTVIPDEVPSLPPASQEESSQSFTSVLLRRINSQHSPGEPSTTTATATVYDVNTVMPDQEESPATGTRSEEISTNQSSSSSSKKRPITKSSSHQSTKRPRQSSPRINQSSPSSSSQTSATKTKQQIQNEAKWKSKFQELFAFKQLHGHTDVPHRWEDNKQLGAWVNKQRNEYKKFLANKKSQITKERIQTLESIDFEWVSPNKAPARNESSWNKRFNELKEYKKNNGHTNVSQKSKDNKELGVWVKTQRSEYKKFKKNGKAQITHERIQKLESIDFEWVSQNKGGPKNESLWNKRFTELKAYKEKYERTDVPRRWKDNKQLGLWVDTQRKEYKKFQENKYSTMTSRRIQMLNSIGFQWECRPPHS